MIYTCFTVAAGRKFDCKFNFFRIEVAGMLNGGKNYLDISAETGASTATISRVNKCLVYGSGYKSALKKLSEENK